MIQPLFPSLYLANPHLVFPSSASLYSENLASKTLPDASPKAQISLMAFLDDRIKWSKLCLTWHSRPSMITWSKSSSQLFPFIHSCHVQPWSWNVNHCPNNPQNSPLHLGNFFQPCYLFEVLYTLQDPFQMSPLSWCLSDSFSLNSWSFSLF